jgi:hypothetical protein
MNPGVTDSARDDGKKGLKNRRIGKLNIRRTDSI